MTASFVSAPASATEDWVQMGDMPLPVAQFSYAQLPDGRVFVSMGRAPQIGLSDATWLFDPDDDSWDEMTPSPELFEGARAVAMPDGKVYMFGGYNVQGVFKMQEHVLIYDSGKDEWSTGTGLPAYKAVMEAVALDDERILLIGGYDFSTDDPLKLCYIYDTAEDELTSTTALPSARVWGVAFSSGGYVYYAGGGDINNMVREEIFRYGIRSGNWELFVRMPEGRYFDRGALGADGILYMQGGETGQVITLANTGTGRAVDMSTGRFLDLPQYPLPAVGAGVIATGDGRLLVFGGFQGDEFYDEVHSFKIFSAEACLDEGQAAPGTGVRVFAMADIQLKEGEVLSTEVYLMKDGLSYGSYRLSSTNGLASAYVPLAEDLVPGDYQVVFGDVDIGSGFPCSLTFETLTLTVTDAPSPNDTIGELQEEIAELKDALTGKMDAWVGYALLVMLAIALAVLVLQMVRKR